jgi:hypothetical protein
MIKPTMPNIPGIGAMTDTLDFMKNLWGNMSLPGMGASGLNMPGMVIPTLSVEELNKKITDLKAVESWLTLNMNMLRGTIQALEVQSATLSTLQNMGESFTSTLQSSAKSLTPEADGAAASNENDNAAEAASARRTKSRPHVPEPTKKDEQDAANLTAPLVNAAAWWNMLQDQFKHAVNTAITPEAAEDKPVPKRTGTKAKSEAASSSPITGSATRRRKVAK